MLITGLCLAMPPQPARQSKTVIVRGVVVDTTSAPVANAEVTTHPDSAGVLTSADGRFSIRSSAGQRLTLRVRRIGFAPVNRTVALGHRDTTLAPIVLKSAPAPLPEVTVQGHVPRPEFVLRPTTRIETALYGKHRLRHRWDTHGVAMSAREMVVVREPPYGVLTLFGWFKGASAAVQAALVQSVGCPTLGTSPVATGWNSSGDTMRMLLGSGATWMRQTEGFPVGSCFQGPSPESGWPTRQRRSNGGRMARRSGCSTAALGKVLGRRVNGVAGPKPLVEIGPGGPPPGAPRPCRARRYRG